MARPALVIFDMDDVLCHYQLGKRLRFLAALADTTARDVRTAIWDSGFEDLADSGGYPDGDDYLREFALRLGAPITRAQWLEARRISMIAIPETLALAARIKEQADIAIYTNNGPLVKEHLDVLLPEAAAIFERRFCSYEFGTKKPDPKSFSRLLDSLGRAPADCWFIDDKRSNVQGARIAGLHAHHYRHPDLLVAAAQELGFST